MNDEHHRQPIAVGGLYPDFPSLIGQRYIELDRS